jgi:hypothetical protein
LAAAAALGRVLRLWSTRVEVRCIDFAWEALMCFVPVEGKDETYRHVHSKFIVKIPSDPKRLAALAEALGIPNKHFANFGRGKILIVNDQGRTAKKKK